MARGFLELFEDVFNLLLCERVKGRLRVQKLFLAVRLK